MRLRTVFNPMMTSIASMVSICLPAIAYTEMQCSSLFTPLAPRVELRFEEESRMTDLMQNPKGSLTTFPYVGLRVKVRKDGRAVHYWFKFRGHEPRELVLNLPEHEVADAELDGLDVKAFHWLNRDPNYEKMSVKDELRAELNAVLTDLYRWARRDHHPLMPSASTLHRRFVQLKYYRDIMEGNTIELTPEKLQPVSYFDRMPVLDSPRFRIGQFTARNGFTGLYIREKPGAQMPLKPFEILTRLLKTGALARVRNQGPGLGAHIDFNNGTSTFVQVIMGWRLHHRLKQCPLCRSDDAWENLPHDSLDFVIGQYRDRRGVKDGVKSRSRTLTEEDLRRTREISENMMNRTLLFSQVNGTTSPVKSFFTEVDFTNWHRQIPVNPPAKDRFDFQGSMSVVISHGSHEPLPCEEYLGVSLPRPPNGKLLVELGRWAVIRGRPTPITKDMVDLVVSSLTAFGDIGGVVVQADPLHARMYRRPGVQDIAPPPGYEGTDEFLLMTLDAFKTLDY